MTPALSLAHPAVNVARNLIEAFLLEFGKNFESFLTLADLLDFRSVLSCYSSMRLGAGEEHYTVLQALQDAPPPESDIESPIIDAAVQFLFDNDAAPAVAEYLIGRITQTIAQRF
ncbi:hypothetical protein H6F51_10510 [Cyanobacteria bacterium FACHB-DQ100]|nr:hypothetical protein [Cyanobacteria bacterium FACHB-DQ100]